VTDTSTADALAYYQPFHFYATSWGIYVRASGVQALAERLSPGRNPDIAALNFTYQLLLAHEQFHFLAEYASSRLEVISDQSSYEGYFNDGDAACHEEALANAYAITDLRRRNPKGLIAAAESWMLTQPQGYRDFQKWLPPPVPHGTGTSCGIYAKSH